MHKKSEDLSTWTNTETSDLETFIQHQTTYRAHVAARFEHPDYRDERRHYLRTSLAAKHKALIIILTETKELENSPELLTQQRLDILDKASRLCGDPRFDLPRTIATLTDKDFAWSKDLVDININNVLKRVHNYVDVVELQSPAYMGLAEALCRYNPEKGVSFTTFASIRVRGSLIDYLRSLDPLARSARIKIKQGNTSLDLERKRAIAQPLSFTECPEDKHPCAHDPGIIDALEPFLTNFPERTRKLLTLRYVHDWTFKEIGEELGICEPRASQIHDKAIRCLQEERGITPQKHHAGVNHSALRYTRKTSSPTFKYSK